MHSKDFLDALDYNRIVARATGRDETPLNEWADLYDAAMDANQAETESRKKGKTNDNT